jgi:two-component system KDP operon response regulator KdpE
MPVTTEELVMSVTRPALALLMSEEKKAWITPLLEDECELHPFSDLKEAVKTLSNLRYDLIILDDVLFGSKTVGVVEQLKQRFPTIPTILVTNNAETAYQTELLNAGVDDFLTRRMPKDKLYHHIELTLRQYRQNRELVQLNRKLHALAALSNLLHSAADPTTLIQRAIRLIANTFRLHGIAVLLKEGDVFRLYAGSEEIGSRNRLYETILRPTETDAFLWTFRSRITQLYSNITANPNYVAIPVLSEAESVAIIPLTHQDTTLGVMAIFAVKGRPLTREDMIIYEQLGAQLSSALRNVQQHVTQHESLQSNQHLLRAWQAFANLNATEDIARALCTLIEEISYVRRACVWVVIEEGGPVKGTCLDTRQGELPGYLDSLISRGSLDAITELFRESMRPTVFKAQENPPSEISLLLEEMEVRQIVVLPVTNTTGLVGGILAGIGGDREYDIESVRLMENLAHTAGRALERIMLTDAIHERNVRLETILRTISEGIFFVDDDNRVAFCNPQVAELTSIPTSKVMHQDVDVLLKSIAAVTAEPTKIYAQLQAARNVMTHPDMPREEYPIVELALLNVERSLYLEFVKFDGAGTQEINWIGVLRSSTRSAHVFKTQDVLFNSMVEHLRIPNLQLRSLASTLAEQHGNLSYRERDQFLRQLETDLEHVNHLWNSYQDIYALETNSLSLRRENASLSRLIERVLEMRPFNRYQRQFSLEMPALLPSVRIDEYRIERALSDVLQRALAVSPSGARITIRVANHEHEVHVTVEDQGPTLRADQLEQVFDPFNAGDRLSTGFGLYITRELVRRHGGRTWAEARNGSGMAITLVLPVATPAVRTPEEKPQPSEPAPSETKSAAESVPRPVVSRAPQRTPNTVMVVEGHSTLVRTVCEALEGQDYGVLRYQRGEEALEDVKATHLDLIILDASPGDINGLDLCARMRKHTEVPIMMIADSASDNEKVLGFKAGADEYVTRPVSDDELMARVQAIFKRQQIPDRTSEPMVAGDLVVDVARREVFLANKPIDLTRIEFDLLHMLISNRNRVLTHRQLLEKVWGPDYEDETHYLWVNISRLRKKLEPGSDSPRYIHTQPGIGYYFEEP